MSIKDKYHVQKIKKEECNEWFLYKHYARRIPNIMYAFGLYYGQVLCGVCSFGMTANKNLNEVITGFKTIELNRLCIEENHEKNVLSFFVSHAVSKLPRPILIISYADSGMNHHGFIYQALNWKYTGMGKSDYEFIKNGRQYHRKNLFDLLGTGSIENAKNNGFKVIKVKPKHRYFYFLGSKKQKKEMLKLLPFEILPYPKGDNKRYDANYNVITQQTLF